MHLSIFCLVLFISVVSAYTTLGTVPNPLNAPDLPGFAANIQTIPAGSLIIPMDTANQVIVPGTSQFSVLPYGLVIRTLHQNISVWWAIKSGKAQNGVDFTASTSTTTFQNIISTGGNPTWSSPSTISYSGGPFIILEQDVSRTLAAWYEWNQQSATYYPTVSPTVYNTVHIHKLATATAMDIRHTIYVRPVVGISNLDGNAPTQTAMMGCVYQNTSRQCPLENGYGWGDIFGNGAAGCDAFSPQDHAGLDWNIHYKTLDCGSYVSALTAATCLTTFSEPHWQWVASTGPSYITAVKNFIASGANFFAQCASVESYEDSAGTSGTGTFLATYGLEWVNPSNGVDPSGTYTNYPDLPCSQYIGEMSSAITGQVPDFYTYFSFPDAIPAGWGVPGFTNPPNNLGNVNFYTTTTYAFPAVTNIINSATVNNEESSVGFDGRNLYVAAGAKYATNLQLGGNVWYLGGHTWAGQSATGTENGRRYFFNAIIVPAQRPPSCGFTFCTVNDTCIPPDACHTCNCSANGNGFINYPIPGCCLSNSNCTGTCQQCNPNSHTCTPIPGCCSLPSIGCGGTCQTCSVSSGVGTCTTKGGCCSNNTQCGVGPCFICNNPGSLQSSCTSIPEPTCCDAATTTTCATGPCLVCASNNTCTRQQPVSSCCLVNTDCGACQTCDTTTHQCTAIPGCCTSNSQCGTNPCVYCNAANACVNNASCCSSSSQCGACQTCSNVTHVCGPSGSTSCCVTNIDCGPTCRRCVPAANGTKTCVSVTSCCTSNYDCELCENCTNSQCVPIAGCCVFDSDCGTCRTCNSNFTCVTSPISLYCCQTDQECDTVADSYGNATCGYTCQMRNNSAWGYCQPVCSSGADYLGLIIGLAAGVPLCLLCLLAIAAALAAFLWWKRAYITGSWFNKGSIDETGVSNSPIHESAVKVGHSPL